MNIKKLLLTTLILGASANIALGMNKRSSYRSQDIPFYMTDLQPTELFNSVCSGNLEEVKKHLKAGIDPNVKNVHGDTVLHKAIHTSINKNAIKIADELIKNGANINAQNVHGYTPSQLAVFNCELPILKLLAENDANFELKDNYGKTTLTVKSTLIFCDKYKGKCQATNNFIKDYISLQEDIKQKNIPYIAAKRSKQIENAIEIGFNQ